jgi:hypothetical protein
VWSYKTPPYSDWDIVSRVINRTGSPISQTKFMLATIYDEEAPAIVYNSATNKYLISTEMKGTTQYIFMGIANTTGYLSQNSYYLAGGNNTDPRNLSRPDVAFNTVDNTFMLVLEYDQLPNHAILSVHIFSSGQPDLNNYYDVATFNSSEDDSLSIHNREPGIAFSKPNNSYVVVYEFIIPEDNTGQYRSRLGVREVTKLGVPLGRDFQTVNTSTDNAASATIRADGNGYYMIVVNGEDASRSTSELILITIQSDTVQMSAVAVPGKRQDDTGVLSYNSVDLQWTIAWARHSGHSKRDASPNARPKSAPGAPSVRRSGKPTLFLEDPAKFAMKPLLEMPTSDITQQEHSRQKRTFAGATADLYVALVCPPVLPTSTSTTTQTGSSAKRDSKPLLWLFVAGIIIVSLMVIAAGIGWWQMRKKNKDKKQPLSAKYVSLNTSPDEDDS